jgi:hypothetical protein
MAPISLSDGQLSAIMSAAQALDRDSRSAFLVEVAAELRPHPEPGDGDVHRAIVAIQQRHREPPDLGHRAPRWE